MSVAGQRDARDAETLVSALRVLGAAAPQVELELVARTLLARGGELAGMVRAAAGDGPGHRAARAELFAVADREGAGLAMLDLLVAVGACAERVGS